MISITAYCLRASVYRIRRSDHALDLAIVCFTSAVRSPLKSYFPTGWFEGGSDRFRFQTGLAVGDIDAAKDIANFLRLRNQVELHMLVERLLPSKMEDALRTKLQRYDFYPNLPVSWFEIVQHDFFPVFFYHITVLISD